MSKTMSAAAAKASFAEALRETEAGESVVITRYGKPVAVLVSIELARAMERLHAADAMSGLAGLVGRYADGAEFEEGLRTVQRSEAPGRSIPEFD